MSIWVIILLIICILIYILAINAEYETYKYYKKKDWEYHCSWQDLLKIIFAPIRLLWIIIEGIWDFSYDYFSAVKEHGGFRGHGEWKKQQKIEEEKRRIKLQAENAEHEAKRKRLKEEWDKIKAAYLNGEIKRIELPRIEDGEKCFEFNPEMGLSVDYDNKVREIVYVESEYNERFNRFFQEHKTLRLFQRYKFIYLPTFCEELAEGDLVNYLYPDRQSDSKLQLSLTSDYPMKYLAYPEDKAKIKQGMFFFRGGCDNHGAEYIEGDYHPLHEGSDEEIIAQLDAIVRKVHEKHSFAAVYCKAKRPTIKEGSTKDYADELFSWELYDNEVAIIVEDVREKIKLLKEKGLAENLLLKLFKEEPKLSRLIVTKDMRIILPDYQNMEIEMEPINKAVYLLFLRHSEGIIFKCLPDYRRELADIYQKIKPFGLNDRALRSIEDVTNPCLNSINEKCARIRGAFISKFDEQLAKNYYITGRRGDEKKIELPRDLIIWEE